MTGMFCSDQLKSVTTLGPFIFRRRLRICPALWLAIFCLSTVSVNASAPAVQDTEPSPAERAAQNIAQIAVSAQNDSDYPFAVQQWEKLLAEYPGSALVGKAHYNAGVCYVNMQDFKSAAAQMSAAVSKLTAVDTQQQPQAYLFLGFSQLRLGQSLNRETDEAAKKEANILLTTSTKTFDDLLQKFPEFDDTDQACYFQGQAFEELKRLEEAKKSYAKMMELDKQTFKFDGLYALANINEQLGNYTDALDYYEKFRAVAEGGHPLLDEVNFRTAKTVIGLAVANTNTGDATAAAANYKKAEQIFGALADQNTTGKPPEFLAIADEAQYQQAYCFTQLGEFETAAQIYEKVATRADSPFRTQALVYAGRSYAQAGKENWAISNLKKAVESDSPFAIEGAVSLSNLYLKNGDNAAAFEITDQWIKKSPNSPLLPVLMADRADAAYRSGDKRAQSPPLFLEIVDKYPTHGVAPSALYNAAYAMLESNDLDNAIANATRFEKAYPTSDFLPDTLEVKADALLLKNNSAGAEKTFDQLIAANPDHEKTNRWRLRTSVAKYLQKKYQAVIDLLQPKLDAFTTPAEIAEANHWIGASHFYLEQYEPAATHLQQSIAADKTWRAADETLLTLARAQVKLDKPDEAKKTLEQLIAAFPKSTLVGNAHYYLGENAYQAKQYEAAYTNFDTVIKNYADSELVPLSLYSAAWSQLELEKYNESDALFTKLIADFPKHELAEKAKIGRGAARRKTGNTADSIADLNAYLASNPTGTAKFNAMYELGLAQVEGKSWPDAVKTFETLLAEDGDASRVDRYRYELAWALIAVEQPAAALKQFAAIVEQSPTSPLAAEANFHVGTGAYEQNDFPAAIAAYEKCVANEAAPPDVREKALYKLGWANYKQDQFAPAHQHFAKQVELYPAGKLAADGKFMIAESQFRQKNHDAALTAYLVAKPAVDAADIDPKIKLLTMLHGAQSANQVKKYNEALQLAKPLVAGDVDPSFKYDAWLEIGTANEGLDQPDEAFKSWTSAKLSDGTTGARAACMIGDLLFKQKKFAEAITAFKEVMYRFGEDNTPAEIKPWVAYALYEAARCNFVQVADASDEKKPTLIAEAIKQFESLLEKYPEDRLAPEAKNQLAKLKQL